MECEMKKFIVCGLMLLSACGSRNHYPGAKLEDIKFCRMEARMAAPIEENDVYNECMEALGYHE